MLNSLILINEYDLQIYAENDGKLHTHTIPIHAGKERERNDDAIMTVMNSQRVFTHISIYR
jgi:hypothetical protein